MLVPRMVFCFRWQYFKGGFNSETCPDFANAKMKISLTKLPYDDNILRQLGCPEPIKKRCIDTCPKINGWNPKKFGGLYSGMFVSCSRERFFSFQPAVFESVNSGAAFLPSAI